MCAALIYSQDIDVDELKSKLPQDIVSKLGNFSNSTFSVDDVKNIWKSKCMNVTGNEESYKEIESGAQSLVQCITTHFNSSAIENEINEARPKGELDAVFNKYCSKRPQAVECLEEFNNKIRVCLTEEEKTYQNISMRIATSLFNFICHKGGDQIALFIAEKGPECFDSKKTDLINCGNKTFGDYIPKEGISDFSNLPKFVIGPKQCRDIDEFQNCAVAALESCEEITPANIVESMFRFIRNETTCPETKTSARVSSSSRVLSSVVSVLLISIITRLLTY